MLNRVDHAFPGLLLAVALFVSGCAYAGSGATSPPAVAAPPIPSETATESSSSSAANAAFATCQTSASQVTAFGFRGDDNATVSAAYVTDLRTFQAALDKQSGVTEQQETLSPSDPPPSPFIVTICYLDGDFGPTRGDTSGSIGDYTRVIVSVDAKGRVMPIAAGRRETLPILTT